MQWEKVGLRNTGPSTKDLLYLKYFFMGSMSSCNTLLQLPRSPCHVKLEIPEGNPNEMEM